MARWWTKSPIIIAALGVLAFIIAALLPQPIITQQRSGAGDPAIGSENRDVTIRQEGAEQLRKGQGQSAAARIWNQMKQPPSSNRPPPPPPPWCQLLREPAIVGLIGVLIGALLKLIGDLGVAFISRPRATSPTETKE